MSTKPLSSFSLSAHYKKRLTRSAKASALESMPGDTEPPLNDHQIKCTLERSEKGLYKLIENYLDNDPVLKEIADRIIREGGDPLRAVANEDDEYLANHPHSQSMLEVIVKTDGSRPSFLIKNDVVDLDSSPVGDWNGQLEESADDVKIAIQSTGRINIVQKQIGTGFLVQRNLIVTNRHVLQSIAKPDGNDWNIDPGANIDFGYEYKTRLSVNPRRIKKVAWCGSREIDSRQIDHSRLDIAILEVEPVPDEMVPLHLLHWDADTGWAWPGTRIYIIGYPGDPRLRGIQTYTASLLDKLFQRTYGCKRLAPGEIMAPGDGMRPLTITHDATTLGGNSGSNIVTIAGPRAVCGLHYGGEVEQPRQNWGHNLGYILPQIQEANPGLYDLLK